MRRKFDHIDKIYSQMYLQGVMATDPIAITEYVRKLIREKKAKTNDLDC